jgi:hypothetical protein
MRKQITKTVLASAAFVSIGLATTNFAAGEQVTYTIDPLQSTLTLLGNLSNSTAQQQGGGSLSTAFSGSIVADRTGNTILFPSNGGSAINALNSGSWRPDDDGFDDTDLANYGRQAPWEISPSITVFEAIRDLTIDLWDDNFGVPSTISGTGTFNSNSFFLRLDDGESDLLIGNSPGIVSHANKETSNSNNNGLSTVTVDGDIEKLTLKFSSGGIGYSISTPGDSSFSFTGTVVATRTIVPEPGAVGLLAICGAALLARGRRE